MMKVGILSDIHGNIDALRAVLSTAKHQKVEKLLVLGDFVGYYYHPDQVLEELSHWNCEFIKGNHEEILEDLIEDKLDSEIIKEKYGSGHQEAILKLSNEQKNMLLSLPHEKELVINGKRILMCHGANFDKGYYLYPTEESEVLNKCVSAQHDYIFVGHSHYQFVRHQNNTTLVNVGSVGQSRLNGGIANWVILHTSNGCVQTMSTSYKTNDLIDEVEVIDPSIDYLSKILRRNNE